jgi:hypothetical protein
MEKCVLVVAKVHPFKCFEFLDLTKDITNGNGIVLKCNSRAME